MIAIRYTGGERRIIDPYEWSDANGRVCKVPVELAANLLTYPTGGFELAGKLTKADKTRLEELIGDEVNYGE